MKNPETLATLGTQDTRRRQQKTKNKKQKQNEKQKTKAKAKKTPQKQITKEKKQDKKIGAAVIKYINMFIRPKGLQVMGKNE
jgi:hypothetical protein